MTRRGGTVVSTLPALLVCIAFAGSTHAQSVISTVNGTVHDSAGNSNHDAHITLTIRELPIGFRVYPRNLTLNEQRGGYHEAISSVALFFFRCRYVVLH